MNQIIHEIGNHLKQANHIVILTGAGVSTDSGIPDFRSAGGIWDTDQTREYYMSNHYYRNNPDDFWKKYKQIFQLKLAGEYEPNEIHDFLKRLEEEGKHISIITQNVDGLHTKAGSRHVLEYHGTLATASCPACGDTYPLTYVMNTDIPLCGHCSVPLKPDVVLFGDPITEHEKAEQMIEQAEFMLVLGTSLWVKPFNLLPEFAVYECNIPAAIINREPTAKDNLFDFVVHSELKKAISKLQNDLFHNN